MARCWKPRALVFSDLLGLAVTIGGDLAVATRSHAEAAEKASGKVVQPPVDTHLAARSGLPGLLEDGRLVDVLDLHLDVGDCEVHVGGVGREALAELGDRDEEVVERVVGWLGADNVSAACVVGVVADVRGKVDSVIDSLDTTAASVADDDDYGSIVRGCCITREPRLTVGDVEVVDSVLDDGACVVVLDLELVGNVALVHRYQLQGHHVAKTNLRE